jgi:sialic acid synthase SpsE
MSTKIIADFCANHLGDKRLIEQGIKLLAEAGVDIVKFQAFRAEDLNKAYEPYALHYAYYKSVELKDSDYKFIIERCKHYGIEPLFTVFTLERLAFIEELGLEKVKIASPDGDNDDLIDAANDSFDETIVSTGMIDQEQIKNLRTNINNVLLYCISKYPTLESDIDYDKMRLFDGFSDHTASTVAAKRAIDFNLEYVEKHFTLGKHLPGRDQAMSSTLEDFKEIVAYRNFKDNVKKYKIRWAKNND